jgi:hypothetical protein
MILRFFKNCAQQKWFLRAAKHADYILSQIIGVRFQVSVQPLVLKSPSCVRKKTDQGLMHITRKIWSNLQ